MEKTLELVVPLNAMMPTNTMGMVAQTIAQLKMGGDVLEAPVLHVTTVTKFAVTAITSKSLPPLKAALVMIKTPSGTTVVSTV